MSHKSTMHTKVWLGIALCLFAVEQSVGAQSIDITFNPGSGVNGAPAVIATYPDGRIVIAGGFSQYNGSMRRGLARLQSDGTLDATFDPMEGPNGSVKWIFPQADEKLIIAGDFSTYNSLPRPYLARLRADGSVDLTFPAVGINGYLQAAAAQSDGKILLAGNFTQINGTNRNNFARINTNGTLDLSFSVTAGVVGAVNGLTTLANGKVLVFGSFSSIGGSNRSFLARLHENGAVDNNLSLPFMNGSDVTAAVEQSDGKILICGEFTSIDGYSRIRVARLNSDGSLDLSFYTPLGVDYRPYVVSASADGKALLGGPFANVSGALQNYLARLNADGTVDSNFNPRLNGQVTALRAQFDGQIVVCGWFTTVNGTNINRIVRLIDNGTIPPGTSLLSARLYPTVFLHGTTGNLYRIEYVTNLTNAAMWTPLTNLLLPSTPYLLLDTTWTNSRQRFYRAVTLP